MKELVFATNNRHKLEEVERLLGGKFKIRTLAECGIHDDIPEEEPTLEGNALAKARYVYERLGHVWCFADDTGLEVEALGGEPGVRSARYATDGHDFAANNRLLMSKLSGEANRAARFRTVVALIADDGTEHLFEGRVEGRIAESESGGEGFGYDPLFVPTGYDCTFAQMSLDQKNAISHRARAVAKLVQHLKTID